MTLIVTESFDGHQIGSTTMNNEYLDAKHGKYIAGLSGRQGGSGFSSATVAGRHGNGLVANSNASLFSIFDPAEEDDLIVCGFAISRGFYGPLASTYIWTMGEFRNVSGTATYIPHVSLKWQGGSQIDVLGGAGTTLASFNLSNSNDWKYIEIKVRVHDTTGSVIVKLDNVIVVNLTNVDTRNNSSGTTGLMNCAAIQIASVGGSFNVYDDIYILNEQGSAPFNDFLGDVTIAYLQPSGAGSSTAWTPSAGTNWDAVSDPITTVAPQITDYVSSSTNDQKDQYAVDNLTQTAPSVPLAVAVYAYTEKLDSGLRTLGLNLKVGANETQSADLQLKDTNAGGPQYVKQILQVAPSGSAWSLSDVNNMEIGVVCRP